jgi:uncharacterized protein (TIGR03000 family)
MYSVVLATVLTAGGTAPDCHFSMSFGCHGCHGCSGGCYGGCSGGCYGGCWGCSGGSGCSGCYGCWGGSYGSGYGSGYSYPSYWTCYGSCYGSCFGSCYGGCYGGYGVPVIPSETITTTPQKTAPAEQKKEQKPEGSLESRRKAPATVLVKVPANARLSVNGLPTAIKGSEQLFATPDLEAGRTYAYNFQVETVQDGKTVSRTRRLIVQAGQRTEVDLNEAQADTARITVKLPADGRVIVDGIAFTTKDGTRTFETPKLEPGRSYYYTLRAEVDRDGKTQTEDKRVVVEAGKEVRVDFTSPPAVRTVSR